MELKTTIIHTSIRGDKDKTIPNQDYIQFTENDNLLIATISDGLGSSKHSREGAEIACRSVIDILENLHFQTEGKRIDDLIRNKWNNEIELKTESISEFRTTNSFVAVFKKKNKIIVGQLGDVMVSLRIDGLFRYIDTVSKDFSNETVCLGSNQIENYKLTFFDFDHSFDFLIASDGISDELHPNRVEDLHDYFIFKFDKIELKEQNNTLNEEIISFVNQKNNDDKSIIFIWTN